MSADHRFFLTTPITYAHRGDVREAQFIELREPTGKLALEAAPIRQGLLKAIRENEERAEIHRKNFDPAEIRIDGLDEDDKPELPAPEVPDPTDPAMDPMTMLFILGTSSIDLRGFYDHVKRFLFQPGVAFVDGEEPLKVAIFESLSLSDSEKLIGAYCARFLAASSPGR